jgi:hypothetical protein
MKKFAVEVSRRFVQTEGASIVVEAASKAEARRIAKAMAAEPDAIPEKEWAPVDSEYDSYSVDEIDEA